MLRLIAWFAGRICFFARQEGIGGPEAKSM
jgi:hypothetical protein